MAIAKKAKKAVKKPAKKVAKKMTKKPAKKVAGSDAIQVRMDEAKALLKRMRDAGVPAGATGYGDKKQAGHQIAIHHGDLVIIHGMHSSISKPPYPPGTPVLMSKPPYPPGQDGAAPLTPGVSPMAYPHGPGGGVVTIHIKSGGHTLVRTGDEAIQHANEVLGRFHKG